MATQETTRLCTWIIRSHFGILTATVAEALATRGRLSFRDLAFFTKLKPRIIRGAIIVLVQHNLLWHSNSDGDEVFELIVEGCFMRLRFGKYVQIAQELLGDEGAEVVQTILDHGRIRLPDICTRLPHREPIVCAKTLRSLIRRHLVKSTTEYLNQSRADRISELERKLISEDADTRKAAIVAAKKLAEKRSVASSQVAQLENEAESLGLTRTIRGASSKTRGVKKEKDSAVDQDVWFRINFSKFNVYYLNTLIESSVRAVYNEQAARVMRAILRASEDDQLSLTESRSQPISNHHILDELSPIASKDELSSGLASKSAKPSSMAEMMKDYIAILSALDNPTPTGRAAAFISTGPSGGAGKVQIEFENIYHRLQLSVLEGYIRERWGPLAVRVARILVELGNVDEKHFTKVGLLAPSEVRPIISELQTAGIIELREVPKGKDFAPSRTFYFWHLDLRKAYAVLLSSLTNTLANILERQAAESSHAAFKSVLEKRERTDVAEDQDLLTRPEKESLQDWEERMMRLTAAAGRVDEAAFVLRDLGVFSQSHFQY